MRILLALIAALASAACSVVQPPQPPSVSDVKPLPMVRTQTLKGQSGGVFVPEAVMSLTADRRAIRPGDVLTVSLQETTRASKRANTQIGKESSVGISPSILGGGVVDTEVALAASRDFSGNASSSQQNMLTGTITVVVHEVLPNGLLLVEGEKNLYLNQGEEMVRLSGYVRPEDIDNQNQVSSLRIANARIVYAGRGTLADANTAGWLTRFFMSPWMPF